MSSQFRSRITVFAMAVLFAALMAGTTAVPAFAKSQPAKMKAIIKSAAKSRHLGDADVKALFTLCKRESDFNPRCITGSCYGLFQMTRDGWLAHGKRWANPRANTVMAIAYIKHRYGTPRKALAHSYSHGWY